MELVDLENRIKELNMSIFEMKELIKKSEQEANDFVKQKQDLVNNTNRAIVMNEGRIAELEKLIKELKEEEETSDGQSREAT